MSAWRNFNDTMNYQIRISGWWLFNGIMLGFLLGVAIGALL